ncbi:MAG: NlpC/P60 family protein [Hyphomonas sp.]|nr:NlpC/P60 family protein [Hyphomonas sp.]
MLPYNDARLTLPSGGSRTRFQVSAGVTAMRKHPEPDATQISQVLFGEVVLLHHEDGEFALVQSELDHYVGWVLVEALSLPVLNPTHRIIAPRIHTYAGPSVTAAANFVLGRAAQLTATGKQDGRYLEFERAGWIAQHLVAPMDDLEIDPADVAEQFIGTPYLWGGRDCLGVDCSGLVQVAFGACGIQAPRDSDMQSEWFGNEISDWRGPGALRRGDLIFWKGHVGIMLDAKTLLHSNGTFMTTMAEPLEPAIERIANEYGAPIRARRIDLSESVGVRPDWLTPQG